MTTYGDTPGVEITVEGGAIADVLIGTEEKLLLIGEGDTDSEYLTPGDVHKITSRRRAREILGEDSELTRAVLDAFQNGANPQFTYALHLPDEEDFGVDELEEEQEPIEWVFDAGYEDSVDEDEYDKIENPAKYLVGEGESGVYGLLNSVAEEDTITALEDIVDDERENNYAMTKIVTPLVDDESEIENVEPVTDSDSVYEYYPNALRHDDDRYVDGGVIGAFAGNAIDEPIYNQQLRGYDELQVRLSRSETTELRDSNVIPIRQNGSVRIEDNQSTSTDELEFQSHYWQRRIVDRVILAAHEIGQSARGRINDEQTIDAVRRQIVSEIRSMIDDRLLEDGDGSYYVEVEQEDAESLVIDLGVTPRGLVKRVTATIEIDS